jgi:hypothetical protein
MGWENCHLHEFLVGTKRFGVPDPTYDAPGVAIVEGKFPLAEVPAAPALRFATSTISAITGCRILRRALSVLFGAMLRLATVVFGYLRPVPNIVGTPRWIVHGIVHPRIKLEEVN